MKIIDDIRDFFSVGDAFSLILDVLALIGAIVVIAILARPVNWLLSLIF